jgi:hypothetical protein
MPPHTASGRYPVYFAALGKQNMEANLEGWIYNASAAGYLLHVESVTVKLQHATGLGFRSRHDDS